MRVVVPFAAEAPKTRLDDVLSPAERDAFARAMLDDVLAAIRGTGHDPILLATAPVDLDVPVTVDERSLTPAVNAVIEDEDGPVAVVMADLALATTLALERLFAAPGDVVIAPGRAGGTNALVVRATGFRCDFHGTSYLDHLAAARRIGASIYPVDSHRLATDIDERADLVEVLVHGDGRAARWLDDAGFGLVTRAGRVAVDR